jgi:hypothetical protein
MLIAAQLLESPAERKPGCKKLRIGLALSGGGFRAALFHKTLLLRAFRSTARSGLMAREYDRWFYKGDKLDQLPRTAAGKDRPGSPPRVSAEFIASLGRIRTDLDPFSHIEVEALTDIEPSARRDVGVHGTETLKS